MIDADARLSQGVRRVLLWQALVAISIAAVSAGTGMGGRSWLAALAGGGIAMVGTVILGHTLLRTTSASAHTTAPLWLYGGALARFVLALSLLALALGVLRLRALPLLAAFALAQLVYPLAQVGRRP
ncbi:MAG: hypothetical protein ACYCXG_05550 [Acidiferrobacter sp.]